MPNTVLNFNVADRQARAAFPRLQRELSELADESRSVQREARAAGEAVDTLGDRITPQCKRHRPSRRCSTAARGADRPAGYPSDNIHGEFRTHAGETQGER